MAEESLPAVPGHPDLEAALVVATDARVEVASDVLAADLEVSDAGERLADVEALHRVGVEVGIDDAAGAALKEAADVVLGAGRLVAEEAGGTVVA